MRHGVAGRKLNRSTNHRRALRRNLVQSLVEHGRIRTTLPKAREVRAMADKLVTLAIRGDLAARRLAISILTDRAIIPKEHKAEYDKMSDAKRERVLRSRSGRRYRVSTTRPGAKFTAESVIHRLFATIGPAMRRRNERLGCSGGYTRIIKLADRRLGDAAPLAFLEFVAEADERRPKLTDKTNRKRKSKLRYSFYAGKPLERRGGRRRGAAKPEEIAPQTAAVESPAADGAGDEPKGT